MASNNSLWITARFKVSEPWLCKVSSLFQLPKTATNILSAKWQSTKKEAFKSREKCKSIRRWEEELPDQKLNVKIRLLFMVPSEMRPILAHTRCRSQFTYNCKGWGESRLGMRHFTWENPTIQLSWKHVLPLRSELLRPKVTEEIKLRVAIMVIMRVVPVSGVPILNLETLTVRLSTQVDTRRITKIARQRSIQTTLVQILLAKRTTFRIIRLLANIWLQILLTSRLLLLPLKSEIA